MFCVETSPKTIVACHNVDQSLSCKAAQHTSTSPFKNAHLYVDQSPVPAMSPRAMRLPVGELMRTSKDPMDCRGVARPEEALTVRLSMLYRFHPS